MKALEVELTADQTAALDALTVPAVAVPHRFPQHGALSPHSPGATVNGEPSQSPLVRAEEEGRSIPEGERIKPRPLRGFEADPRDLEGS